jgi:penicillin-binding protein 1A
MSQASAVTLIDMMRGVVNRGTGTAVRTRFGILGDIAGKTGTTQNNADGWFILMHPNLVAGAWVGFNDNRVAMRSSYWGQGGHNAVLLVGEFFKTALDSGRIDRAAQFPGGPPPVQARPAEPVQTEEVMEEGGEMRQEGAPAPAEDPDLQISPEPEPEEAPDRRQDRQARERDVEVDRQIQLDRQQQLERRVQPERRQEAPPPDRDFQERRPPDSPDAGLSTERPSASPP